MEMQLNMKSEETSTETQMVIHDGYKLTELGEIPEDWQCVQLGEIGQCIIGLTYSPQNISDSGILVLRSSNVQNGKLTYEDNVFVNMELPERVIVKKGDILICVRNGSRQLIGKCALIDQKAEGFAFGAFMSIYRTSAHDYIFYQFQSNLIQNQINETMGATINQITNKDLSSFKIPIPNCVEEQKAIANVLSDTDALITELEQLITKKQAIKTATMQQLLTGRTRLSQFAKHPDGVLKGNKPSELGLIPEDWICVKLGEIGECIIGLTYSPRDVSDTGTLVLRSSNVQNNKLAYQDNVFVNMDLPERVIVRKGDILICVRNGSRKLIGKCALIDHTAEGCAFGAFMAIYRTTAHDFIFYQFQSNLIHNQIDETMGATINQITNKDLSGFIISMPSCDQEQTAISTILLDMDAELEALEQKLAKFRDIKQGMMQQLLTGRIRLPLEQQP